jgi:hypothetical protein
MKTWLRISLILNLGLLVSLIFLLVNQRKQAPVRLPVLSRSRPRLQAAASSPPATPEIKPVPFRWSQLESRTSYQTYVANLRAIGCPEPTIEDIVRGDAERAFSWERSQLSLDGSGKGPWSRFRQTQVVASLLSETPETNGNVAVAQDAEKSVAARAGSNETAAILPAQSPANQTQGMSSDQVAESSAASPGVGTAKPAYPLFLQNVNWSALGFTAEQQATIEQVRQQYLSEYGNSTSNPNSPANQNDSAVNQASSPTDPNEPAAGSNPQDTLPALLGSQAWARYELLQYYSWYQPQVLAAAASGKPLVINPDAYSPNK